MRLPTFRATTAPPRETGLVRADPQALTNTGDAEFRAIAGAGRAIQNVGGIAGQAAIQRKNLDNEAAAGRADARSIDALTEATNAINGQDFSQNTVLPDDPKKYYSGETGDILEFTTEDKIKGREEQIGIVNGRLETLSKAMGFRGEKARLAWLEGKKDAAREILTKVSNAKQNEYQTELFLGNARNAAANGDMEVSEQWIELAEDSGLIGPKLAAKERKKNLKLSIEEEVTGLYRAGLYDEAKKVLEASSLSSKEKEQLDDEIDADERLKLVEFENDINSELVDIDNDPNMTQANFNDQAEATKEKILVANIPGTLKKKMLSDLEKWRRGTNEIDYAKVLSLNQEMDAAQRSGIVDPTIRNRITRASLDGSFGGRNKGGQKIYGDMIRRFEKLQFDERIQATSSIVRTFERENADDPRLIFLFHQAKNKLIADNPDIGVRELFIKISGLAETYGILTEGTIERKLRTKSEETVTMTAPDGVKWVVPVNKKQKFLDNGYTE